MISLSVSNTLIQAQIQETFHTIVLYNTILHVYLFYLLYILIYISLIKNIFIYFIKMITVITAIYFNYHYYYYYYCYFIVDVIMNIYLYCDNEYPIAVTK